MRGLISKEWLYTKRNARAVAIHLLSPLAVILVNVTLLGRAEWTKNGSDQLSIFFGFYTALSFTTVFRAVERVRAELSDGTAHLYLLTRSTPVQLALVKFGFECAINALALVPFVGWLAVTRPGFMGPSDLLHTFSASIALTALTFALSCLVRSDESYRAVTLFLSLTPILPGLVLIGGHARVMLSVIPTLTAFEGFRSISSNAPVDLSLTAILLCGVVVTMTLALWRYPRAFAEAFMRPTT